MNYLRELLYRPKRSDRSLMARFYFADLNLNAVASELDSFDGRKDPERCACLVNRLRTCQDKLLVICNKMLEEVEPGVASRSREFRAKFPDEILTDNLAGQLWFGAECLAAGSSIMHKERESDAMRPLAKAVTKSLDKVRALLREQCLSPQPEYTEKIRENIKIFDRLFAEFEFNYVQCMVHVKTVKEYELHQDLIVLFSDTLQRAIRHEMVTQDMVDLYEPSLMFAIPRLAIVFGLLHSPTGPLNVDRSSADFPDLFLPFKNLLRKIRELLLTLAPHEVLVLEMLLCQHEEPANITSKLKEVERMLERAEEGKVQAEKLQEKLDDFGVEKEEEEAQKAKSSSSSSEVVVRTVLNGILGDVMERVRVVEIDCTGPEIQVMSRRLNVEQQQQQQQQSVQIVVVEQEDQRPNPSETPSQSTPGAPPSSFSPRPRQRLKRHNAKRDSKRIPLRYQKDRRSKFKSTEDLLHRLYVCISGAADQLQSNYAGDFRSILRNVFVINTSKDDLDDLDPATLDPDRQDEDGTDAASTIIPSNSDISSIATGLSDPFPVDLATDALQHEISQRLGSEHLHATGSTSTSTDDEHQPQPQQADSSSSSFNYAQNLDMQLLLQERDDVLYHRQRQQQQERAFYQPEPTLLDIANGDLRDGDPLQRQLHPAEVTGRDPTMLAPLSSASEQQLIGSPPAWVPDEDAPNCMGCGDAFTLFKRRHHCRSCGLVFCNRCSSHSLALPHFGLDRPVRVCNRCNVIFQIPDLGPRTPESGSGRGGGVFPADPEASAAADEEQSAGTSMARSPWSRNFGMVS